MESAEKPPFPTCPLSSSHPELTSSRLGLPALGPEHSKEYLSPYQAGRSSGAEQGLILSVAPALAQRLRTGAAQRVWEE